MNPNPVFKVTSLFDAKYTDTAIVTIEGESYHSLTFNISEMAKDTAIVTMEGENRTQAFKWYHCQ